MPEPSKIPAAWAWDGDTNVIPATDPGNGLASWELGYPVETQTPIAAGGVPPRRQDMNGVLNWLSQYSLWEHKGGMWAYDATENYEKGNVVIQSNVIYYCKAANGPSGTVKSPSADTAGTYWKKLVNADGTLNVPVIGNATTSARGIVELATSAETKALTDAQRAVTPSSLNGLLSLSPAASVVPKADSNGKLTGWLDALKSNDGRVAINISGTAPQLQTARTIRTNLASASAASFNGTVNVTPGVTGTLPVGNGGTGQTNLDAVTVGKAKALNTSRTVRTNLASTSTASFDGTANITPGVTGTLSVANGGTGQTNLDNVTVGKAKALNTARNIQTNLASSTAASFNGTANVSPGVTGVLPIANGGTGSSTKIFLDTTSNQTFGPCYKILQGYSTGWGVENGPYKTWFLIGADGIKRGLWDNSLNKWLVYIDSTNEVYMPGLAGRATKLETARTIRTNLTSTATASFDGSANVTPGVTGTLSVANGGTGQTNLDNVTVGKAKQLNTARAINGTNFDGSAAITTAQWGTARNVTIKDATQTNTGAAVSVNGAEAFSLLLPSTIKAALNGNADTATKLQTARTINGVSFNGTSDITVPESSARSIGNSGYIKFQSGLIVQWGRSNFGGEKYKDVSLPIVFPNALFAAFASDSINNAVTSTSQAFCIAWSMGASDLSKIRFVSNRDDTELFVWLAIGY